MGTYRELSFTKFSWFQCYFAYQAAMGNLSSSSRKGRSAHVDIVKCASTKKLSPKAKEYIIASLMTLYGKRVLNE